MPLSRLAWYLSVPKLEGVLSNVTALKKRLDKADSDARLSREEFLREMAEAIKGLSITANHAAGDRVQGQITRQFEAYTAFQQKQFEVQSKAIKDIASLVLSANELSELNFTNIRASGDKRHEAIADQIRSLPNNADALGAIQEGLGKIPTELTIFEQRDADLKPVLEAVFRVLEKVSEPVVIPKRKDKFTFTIKRDEQDLITRIVVT